MKLAFPTRPSRRGPTALGQPDLARPCNGHPPLVIDETCLLCGHLPRLTIERTWLSRARSVARR